MRAISASDATGSGCARDILKFAVSATACGRRCALAMIVGVDGSFPRPVGALMAINDAGQTQGYLSNGCIDEDVVRQARECLADGRARRVRYGAGSPFVDIRLPCGGGVDILILPDPDPGAVAKAADGLDARAPMTLSVSGGDDPQLTALRGAADGAPADFSAFYAPPLSIVIAGRGEEPLALARLARAAQYDVSVLTPDRETAERCAGYGAQTALLRSTGDIPALAADPWTAIALLFHDHEWEIGVLAAALNSQAYYIGAMGSRRAHADRLNELRNRGFDQTALDRITAPAGLVPSARDASTLAVSILAQIVGLYRDKPQ